MPYNERILGKTVYVKDIGKIGTVLSLLNEKQIMNIEFLDKTKEEIFCSRVFRLPLLDQNLKNQKCLFVDADKQRVVKGWYLDHIIDDMLLFQEQDTRK